MGTLSQHPQTSSSLAMVLHRVVSVMALKTIRVDGNDALSGFFCNQRGQKDCAIEEQCPVLIEAMSYRSGSALNV